MPRRRLPPLLALLAATLVAALFTTAAPARAATPDGIEADLLVLLNKQRASAGLQPMVLDGALRGVARNWSARMAAGGLAHNPALRTAIEGSVTSAWTRFGENVGVGSSARRLHRAFWDSPGHRANVLGAYNRVGIGAVVAGGRTWVTLDFVEGPAVAGPTGVGACATRGYLLEADGTVRSAGVAAPLRGGGTRWPGSDLARDLTLAEDGSGHVVDAFGGLHPVGGADQLRPRVYWPGRDLVRGVAVRPNGRGAFVLDAFGGLHPAGAARLVAPGAYWPGQDRAEDVQVDPRRGTRGYVLDSNGGLHRFGRGLARARTTWEDPFGRARSFSFLPGGRGGYVTDVSGNLHPFAVGGSPLPRRVTSPIAPASPATGSLSTPSGAVAVTAGGSQVGLREACARPGRWGTADVVRAVVAR